MEYFGGLDVSMAETHVCVMNRDGAVAYEVKVPSTPADIAAALAQAPTCARVVFETGRMAPMLYHGLSQLGLPIVCIESRQAYHARKSLATHKTDRNDARGLAHLARTGFFKAVHVKSLSAHALRSLIVAQEAGRPACHPGEPDPRPGRGIRCATAACVNRGIHPAGLAERARASSVCPPPCAAWSPHAPPCSPPSRRSMRISGNWREHPPLAAG